MFIFGTSTLLAAQALAQPQYTVTDLGTLGGQGTTRLGVTEPGAQRNLQHGSEGRGLLWLWAAIMPSLSQGMAPRHGGMPFVGRRHALPRKSSPDFFRSLLDSRGNRIG
jgi:hypothetical protein